MAQGNGSGGWELIPSSHKDIESVRQRCRRLVLRRAAMSAGVAAIPIPGIDILTDINLFARLIDEINAEFGLTPEQIRRLRPQMKLLAYETMAGIGGAKLGQVVAGEVLRHLANRTGAQVLVKHSAKIVPFAGQVVSAALGFSVFRTIGYQHVEACALVAQELLVLRTKPAQ